MDETAHLLSSIDDHLGAAFDKSTPETVRSQIEEATTIAAELTAEDDQETVIEGIDELLETLDGIEAGNIENPDVEEHLDAARRAARRVQNR